MLLIVGLGNPGEKYKNTRHNVGFMILDEIVKQAQSSKLKARFSPPHAGEKTSDAVASNYNLKLKIDKKLKAEIYEVMVGDKKVVLAKPLTFMNRSGEAVKKLTRRYSLDARRLILIHDDLDIPLGKYKIQLGKGPKEHKGVESVEKALGTKKFWRVRVGIENRINQLSNCQIIKLGKKISGEEYVLEEFSKEEKKIIDQVILEVVEEIKKHFLKSRA